MNTPAPVCIGVGFDTARYGHHVSFLRADRQPAAPAFTFAESPTGYAQLRQALERLQNTHDHVHFHIRIDAAGQYAANLERFLRTLPGEKTISVGQPKQNRDYRNVHFSKRKADAVDALACARFALVEQPAPTPETPLAFAPLGELAGALESQTKQTTRLVNQLHNRLARVFPELALHVPDLAATWVLRLLEKYPSAARIAGAHGSSLRSIPHLTQEKAETIQAAARQTVASLQGPVVEGLIRQSVQAIRHSQKTTSALRRLLQQAYDELPAGPHQRIQTIPGIGPQTAAALVAKIVDIDRFATPEAVVNYFGVFPEESTSGVDKHGRPLPAGTMTMSRKGNDLVRRCLWNAAKTAIMHNPVVHSLYARQRAAGKRGDVALGHCMRKLLHLVFAVWKTDRPFAPPPAPTQQGASVPPQEAENAGGRTGPSPDRQAVTPAPSNIPSASHPGNAPQPEPVPAAERELAAAAPARDRRGDFAQLRQQMSMEKVLRELHAWDGLKGRGAQRRGPCPIHEPSRAQGRSFEVDLEKNIFHCFDASGGVTGDALDLWAHCRRLSIAQAARDLAERFGTDVQERGQARPGTRRITHPRGTST